MTHARYCQEETPEFVARMDAWVSQIASLLRSHTGANYVATILIGGYGRGWGAMIASDAGPMPVNDLDIALVTEVRLPARELAALREDATAIVNPASGHTLTELSDLDLHVDVMNFARADMAGLYPTQFHVDLVHSGRLVDGEDVLQSARRVPMDAIDPGDALLSICNNSSSVYEPLAVGDVSSHQTRVNLWMFATKAPIAASAAMGIIRGVYSPMPDERVRRLESLISSEAGESLRADGPRFCAAVREATQARAEVTLERLALTPRYFEIAREVMLITMRYALVQLFSERWIDDPAELGVEAARLWRREYLRPQARPLGRRARDCAKAAAGLLGIRPRQAPWRPRARVYCASIPLLAAVRLLPDWTVEVDEDLTRAAERLIALDESANSRSREGFRYWRETARGAVAALKRQNWDK